MRLIFSSVSMEAFVILPVLFCTYSSDCLWPSLSSLFGALSIIPVELFGSSSSFSRFRMVATMALKRETSDFERNRAASFTASLSLSSSSTFCFSAMGSS